MYRHERLTRSERKKRMSALMKRMDGGDLPTYGEVLDTIAECHGPGVVAEAVEGIGGMLRALVSLARGGGK